MGYFKFVEECIKEDILYDFWYLIFQKDIISVNNKFLKQNNETVDYRLLGFTNILNYSFQLLFYIGSLGKILTNTVIKDSLSLQYVLKKVIGFRNSRQYRLFISFSIAKSWLSHEFSLQDLKTC